MGDDGGLHVHDHVTHLQLERLEVVKGVGMVVEVGALIPRAGRRDSTRWRTVPV